MKFKYDVTGAEHEDRKPLEQPAAGVYLSRVHQVDLETPEGKDARLKVQYRIDEGKSKGFPLYDYVNLVSEAAKWKVDEFLMACGVPTKRREKGTLDTDTLVGKLVKLRVGLETWTNADGVSSVQARPKSVFVYNPDDDVEEEPGDDDEELEDEDEEDEEAEEEGDEEIDWDDLGTRADEDDEEAQSELTGYAEAQDIDVNEYETWAEVATLLAGTAGKDYDAMSLEELKVELDGRELPNKGPRSALIARLRKNDTDPF